MDTTETKKTTKAAKVATEPTDTGLTNNVKIIAKRPIRTTPGKGLYTKGDILIVPYGEAEALIAAGAAVMA